MDVMTKGTDGIDVVANALPVDTGYVLCTWDPLNAVVWLIVEHSSFDPIAEGDVIPEHRAPLFRRRVPDVPTGEAALREECARLKAQLADAIREIEAIPEREREAEDRAT
jgi:hypothetical protein